MFMGSLMPDFGRTDYRVKINDDLRMLHETTLLSGYILLANEQTFCYDK